MLSNELGFTTSWKMLTRDKGWIKPILLLTLVGWVPILGQIAVLGYGLEWARLTAWGIGAQAARSRLRQGSHHGRHRVSCEPEHVCHRCNSWQHDLWNHVWHR